MGRIPTALALAMLLATGCVRPVGESSGTDVTQARPPELATGDLAVVSLAIGTGFDEASGELRGASTRLAPSTEVLFAAGELEGVPPPGRVTGRWEYLDDGVRLAEREETFGQGDLEFWFPLTKPEEGWPPGRYKFYLAVNGEDVAGQAFEIVEAPGD
ncbi:MAG: hypothetical protein GF320_00110 [Armatimonadia bacterium]|nr:hypothetical protein [Armatimonadia bacterium]